MPVLSAPKPVLKFIVLGAIAAMICALVWMSVKSSPSDEAQADNSAQEGGTGEEIAAPDLNKLDPTPLNIPSDVMSIAGSSKTAAVLEELQGLVGNAFGEPIDLDAALRTRKTIFGRFTGLSGKFKLRNTNVLDFRRNLAFVLFDPKKYGKDPSAYVIGFQDRTKMEKAFYKKGAKRLERDSNGNWGRYKTSSKAKTFVYVNFVGTHVVFTRHPKLFPDHANFFTQITQHRFAGDGSLTVMVSHGMKAYGDALGEKIEAARGLLSGMAGTETPIQPAAKKALKLVDGFKELTESLERIEGRLSVDARGVRTIFHAKAKPQTALAGHFASLKGSGRSLLEHLPVNAAAFASLSTDGGSVLDTAADVIGVIYALGSGASTPADFKDIEDATQKLRGTLGGDLAQVILPVPNMPDQKGRLTTVQLLSLSSSEGWSEALRALSIKMAAMKSRAQGSGPFVDVSTGNAPFQVNGQPVHRQTFGSPQFGIRLPSVYLWANATHVHATSGRDAENTLNVFALGKGAGQQTNPVVQGIMEQAAANTFAMVFISPLAILHYYDGRTKNALLKKLVRIPKNPLYGKLAKVSKTSGLGMTLGQADGHLEVVFHLPIQLVLDAASLVDTLKR